MLPVLHCSYFTFVVQNGLHAPALKDQCAKIRLAWLNMRYSPVLAPCLHILYAVWHATERLVHDMLLRLVLA
eukprot:1493851-Lingulodinium_polyedra.AAC.1